MIEGIPKISVLVITYNQEDVIGRALDSLVAQKDYLYEICVSDDCSKDRTWEILQEYATKYPGLFILNRNNPNVGIFENIEKTWQMPSGDIVYQLSGDDEAGNNWFRTVVEFINDNNIDWENELFCIYGDYKYVYPNGSSFIISNSRVTSGIDPLRLSLRWKIGNRGCCSSIKVFKKFEAVSQGRSHIAETAQDRQLQLFSEKSYYINKVGNIYYSEIGVSTKIYENENLFKERLEIMPYALNFLQKKGYVVNKKDRYLGDYVKSLDYYNKDHSLSNKVRLIYFTLKTFDSQMDSISSIVRRIGSIILH